MKIAFLDPLGILVIRLSMVLNVCWYSLMALNASNSLTRLENQGKASGYYKVLTGEFRLTRSMLGNNLDMVNLLILMVVVGQLMDIIRLFL